MARLPTQGFDGDVVVHALATPAAAGGVGVDGQAARRIERRHTPRAVGCGGVSELCAGVSAETSAVRPARRRDHPAIRAREFDRTLAHPNAITPLVHLPVMLRAQGYQVIEGGLAAIGPMPDVMGLHKAGTITARESGSRRRERAARAEWPAALPGSGARPPAARPARL